MSIIDQTILHRLLRKEYSHLIDFTRRLERKGFRKLAWAQLDRAEQIGNLIDELGQRGCEEEKRPIALKIDDQTQLQFVRRKLTEARLATM
jgi:hypothetical protein